MKKFGLLGSPISRSPSPAIHRIIMEANGIDGKYILVESDEIPDNKFLREFDGMNVTTPLKEKIMDIVEEWDNTARICGAVNTLFIGGKIKAFNTDYLAILELVRLREISTEKALIIGAGGAAKAAIAAMMKLGAKVIHIQNRSIERAHRISMEMDAEIALSDSYDVIVNAVTPEGDDFLRNIVESISFKNFIDFNYTSSTHLKRIAERREIKGIDGMEILISQALKSQEIWNGRNLSINQKMVVT